MKNLIIFMDCHGNEIYKYLIMNEFCKKEYNCSFISLNSYVASGEKYINNTSLNKNDIEKIKNADVFILQVIEKDRGYLNNENIIKYCKDSCLIIKIPHYRNSIYNYKTLKQLDNKYSLINNFFLLKKVNIENVDETINIIKNEIEIMNTYNYDKEEMKKVFQANLDEFMVIDKLSDIKMNDYFYNNYKLHKLFQSRSYPSSIFFHELSNRILKKLNIAINQNFVDLYFAENTYELLPKYWYDYCGFKFDCKHYMYGHIEVKDYEWFYIILMLNNVNICDSNIIKECLTKIRK